MKTKVEIINETVEYYSADPIGRRAINNSDMNSPKCLYNTPDGRKCAISRYLLNEKEDRKGDIYDLVSPDETIRDLNEPLADYMLKEEVRGHSIQFWKHIQIFHDSDNYWRNHNLSEEGKQRVEYLLKEYAN